MTKKSCTHWFACNSQLFTKTKNMKKITFRASLEVNVDDHLFEKVKSRNATSVEIGFILMSAIQEHGATFGAVSYIPNGWITPFSDEMDVSTKGFSLLDSCIVSSLKNRTIRDMSLIFEGIHYREVDNDKFDGPIMIGKKSEAHLLKDKHIGSLFFGYVEDYIFDFYSDEAFEKYVCANFS